MTRTHSISLHVVTWYWPILERIPRGAYHKVTLRAESDDNNNFLVMAIVVKSGSDKEKMEREPVRPSMNCFHR